MKDTTLVIIVVIQLLICQWYLVIIRFKHFLNLCSFLFYLLLTWCNGILDSCITCRRCCTSCRSSRSCRRCCRLCWCRSRCRCCCKCCCTIYCCKSYDYLELIRYSIRFLRICRICSDYIFVVLEYYCDVFIDNCYILY